MDVQKIAEADRDAATATLVTAFAADPVARWTTPRPETYLAMFPLAVAHMAGEAFVAGGAFATGDMRAVALWLPPGAEPDMEALGQAFAEAGIAPPEEAPEFFARQGAAHPHEPHWYLPFIGVDPAAQGRGLGSALLEAGLAEVDTAGLPAYLESTNPRNVPLYERFGFRVVGEIQVGASPVMHPMWRPAGGR
jgi:ribosomal protein S18 acetylase RimI-like enzyme